MLVDNGRSRVLGSEQAEILYCIRCGACLNTCPVFQQIGGHAYGSVYPGPVGAVLTPALGGLDEFHDLPHASSLCGACRDVCPVRIDIPRMLLRLRAKGVDEGQSPGWIDARHARAAVGRRRGPRLFRLAGGLAARATRAAREGRLDPKHARSPVGVDEDARLPRHGAARRFRSAGSSAGGERDR